ncbi:MAG: hypothetical protein MJY48_03065 [Bacteroidales bacterium]|nr:hypothetical protein [Bacteroidales bacterium]
MKKFFKILMVFALLSGAALSCTKDYSKEIADLQSQNKDLQALVATLQNALNSTNATVSQLSATSEKHTGEIAQIIADHASDIAELAAKDGVLAASISELIGKEAQDVEDLKDAIAALDEKVAGELAQLIVTHNTDIENVKTLFDGKLDALKTTLTEALTQKATELQGEIDGLDGRVTVAEGEIDVIQTTLGEIQTTLETHLGLINENRGLIDKNITDIKAAQDAIAKLQAQVKTLSARLTNIVAAPAKDIELKDVKLGTIEKSILNMEFIVAPESAAKVIADQFAEGKVDVTYALFNALDRTKGAQTKYVVEGIKPHMVKANGAIITVTADVTKALKDVGPLQEDNKYFVTLTVAGEDEAGEFERISDPVSPIYEGTVNIEFQWYKGDAKVATVSDYPTFQTELKAAKTAYEDTVFVRANGTDLYIGAEDADWKTQLPFADNNILNGYELKYETRSHKALTIAETADYLNIEASKIAPHFTETTTAPKKTYTLDEYEQVEWSAYPSDKKAHNLFSASASKTDLTLTAAIKALPGSTDPEKAEFVGAYAEVATEPIALGTVKTLGVVKYTKRIGKHISTYEAVAPLKAEFAFNHPDAYKADSTYKYQAWLSETDVTRHTHPGSIYPKVSKGVFNPTAASNGSATLAVTQSQAKFCDVTISGVKFAATDKEYMIVWKLEPYVNGSGVQAEDYYDYIDLTVEKYHPAVKVAASCEAYVGRTVPTTIKTSVKVDDIFAGDNTWYLNDTPSAAQTTALHNWFKTGFGAQISATKIVETGKTTGPAGLAAADIKITIGADDSLYVTIPADVNNKFKKNTSYTIEAKATIETAVFNFTITLLNKTVKVEINAIKGFDLKDSVEVGAKSLQVGGAWTYVINDINLSQYYKIINFDKKNVNDAVTANFKTPASVKYITGSSVPCSAVASTTDGSLDPSFKIQWDTYNKPSFKLKAWSAVAGFSQVDTIEVTYWTKTPVKVINTTAKDTLEAGHAGEFDLFQDFDVRGIVDDFTKNLIDHNRGNVKVLTVTRTADCPGYGFNEKLNADGFVAPTVAPIEKWTCTVNGQPYGTQETKDLFSSTPAWVSDAVGSRFVLPFKEHSALGTIVFTIPCEWEYSVGTLKFDMVYTLYNL